MPRYFFQLNTNMLLEKASNFKWNFQANQLHNFFKTGRRTVFW